MAAQGHGLPLIVPSVPTGRHCNAVNHCKIERPGNQNQRLKQVTGAVTDAVADLLGASIGGPSCVCVVAKKKRESVTSTISETCVGAVLVSRRDHLHNKLCRCGCEVVQVMLS